MEIIEYNQVDSHALVMEIKKVIDLSNEEDDELQLRLKKYRIVVPVDNDIKSRSILMRLTFPFHLLFFLFILFVVCPIKWVITGSFRLNFECRVARFMTRWGDGIGF